MKKRICAILCAALCVGVLAGCGSTVDADTDMVFVDKKGGVTSVDVETLDKEYYDEEELKSYVDDAVAEYNDQNGRNSVRVLDLSVENGTAKLKMEYKTAEDYSSFNGIELYQGKVVSALAAGYDFAVDFVSVEDGAVSGTASREEIYADDDLQAVIIKANTDVTVDGDICFVSSENVRLTGTDSVSIREGYSLGAETAGGNESVTETATEEAAVSEAAEVQDVSDDGSFETDVYTYIIYK